MSSSRYDNTFNLGGGEDSPYGAVGDFMGLLWKWKVVNADYWHVVEMTFVLLNPP